MTHALYIAYRSNDPEAGRWGPVGRLEHLGDTYRFVYTKGASRLEGFEPFPGMPDLDAIYESDDLFPLFANRLLSRSRPEYDAFLSWSGFDPAQPPDPIAMLGVTEGRRQTDSFEVFPCPTADTEGCYLTKFFLHGLRWMPAAAAERVSKLNRGDRLALMLDLQNPHDPHAVAVRPMADSDRLMLGYVPRYLARDVGTICKRCHPDFIDVTVEKVNASAPLQHRLLCRVNACWPDDFHPCQGGDYEPLTSVPNTHPI